MGAVITDDANPNPRKKNGFTEHKKRAPTIKPPFTYGDLKRAIPAHCFQRSLLRSSFYVAHDLTVIFILYYIASNCIPLLPCLLQYLAWPTYWVAQSCIMFGLWLIAHECGHHAFSDHVWLEDTIGFIIHSSMFIPYFSWKYSHASHHAHTGSMEKDEVYVPKREPLPVWKYFDSPIGRVFTTFGIVIFGLYLYLAVNISGRPYKRFASHYDPYSPIFSRHKRIYIVLSNLGLLVVIYSLYHLTLAKGLMWVISIYAVPVCMTNCWVITVTYLQHTHPSLPHYDSSEWEWLRGALSTVDRDYGVLNYVFHHVTDTHVLHHLFPSVPHYHAIEATRAIKPILGEYYQYDDTPILTALFRAAKECVFVLPDKHNKGIFWYTELF